MISKWKKYISYIYPILLEKKIGKNSSLELWLTNNRLQLATDKAIYSWEDLYYPFSFALNSIKKKLIHVNSCLIVGMGMGSISKILYHIHSQKNINYTAIESETIIVEWAKKYLPNQLHEHTTWINDDASNAIFSISNKFDLICMDVFVQRSVPAAFQTKKFLLQCKTLMNENSILLFNIILHDAEKLKNENFEENFKSVFQKHEILSKNENQIWIGYY
ncbi:MAG: hypothetical protein RL065_156 [Bacteroidota bacterium]|jgi:hypothetical protein